MVIDASVRSRWIQAIAIAGMILLAVLLLLPAVQQAKEAARRTHSKNNLKQIGLALHNYHDVFQCFPPGGIFNTKGRGFHGWGIFIFPYVEAAPLYNQVDFRQAWDAPYNAGCFRVALPVYVNPSIDRPLPDGGFAISHYSANANLISANSAIQLSEIDNRSETFVMGELGGDFVPWGCPYNWRPLGTLTDSPRTYGRIENFGCHFLFADNSVRWVSAEATNKIMDAMRGPNLAGDEAFSLLITRPGSFPFPAGARDLPRISTYHEREER